ncbi:hypothetical protein MRB56_18455 [Halomonas cupida]|uniref:hypothetical protein n=1 Tax=Halomonas cupida TaxID=44933 RepID=UPI001161288E|nr:hypothetical protein [Halomonas cupida]
MATQGRVAVGHQADARPHHTSRSAHLHQCGADDNQIDQDELFDCHVNSYEPRAARAQHTRGSKLTLDSSVAPDADRDRRG